MKVSDTGEVQFYPYWFPEDPGAELDRGWTDRTPLKEVPDALDE